MTTEVNHPLQAFFEIRRSELPKALLMFGYFLLVITSFWILKPIKKSIFITYYDQSGFHLLGFELRAAQAELLAKVLNMFVAYAATIAFSLLSNHLRREQLARAFCVFFMLCYVAFSMLLDQPNSATVWSFYLFGDLFSTLMVATFFAFLNDIVTADEARRTYGIVGLGGVVGGALGSMVVAKWVANLDSSTWLWICFALATAIFAIATIVGRLARKHGQLDETKSDAEDRGAPVSPAIEGARLVFRSRYLLSIVGIVAIYEMVSTIMDYQFSATITHFLDGEAIGQQFATVFAITNATAMFVQLFLTSYIMKEHGVKFALMVAPAAVLIGSGSFAAVPILWTGSLLNTADNAFSYSINQSAKESLYVPTSREEKYKAKAFIDMFVMRAAKALAVGVSLAITMVFTEFEGLRWLSLATLLLAGIWLALGRYAGNQFDRLAPRAASE